MAARLEPLLQFQAPHSTSNSNFVSNPLIYTIYTLPILANFSSIKSFWTLLSFKNFTRTVFVQSFHLMVVPALQCAFGIGLSKERCSYNKCSAVQLSAMQCSAVQPDEAGQEVQGIDSQRPPSASINISLSTLSQGCSSTSTSMEVQEQDGNLHQGHQGYRTV